MEDDRLRELLAAAKRKLELKNAELERKDAELEKKDRLLQSMGQDSLEERLVTQYESRIWRLQAELEASEDRLRAQAETIAQLEQALQSREARMVEVANRF